MSSAGAEVFSAAPEKVPGVFVVGMHRSGTSAVARTLAGDGLTMCPEADLIPANADNAAGFWESTAVVAFNDSLLRSEGGTWLSPPGTGRAATDWAAGQLWKAAAGTILDWLHHPSPWVIKDPRLCLTLPFWLGQVESPPAIVLVLRHPVAIADSLIARDGFTMIDALVLWERYLRSAFVNCVGLPTVVVSFEDVVRRPAAWQAERREFLRALGIAQSTDSEAPSTIDPSLQHWKESDGQQMTGDQRQLWEMASTAIGIHESLPRLVPQ